LPAFRACQIPRTGTKRSVTRARETRTVGYDGFAPSPSSGGCLFNSIVVMVAVVIARSVS